MKGSLVVFSCALLAVSPAVYFGVRGTNWVPAESVCTCQGGNLRDRRMGGWRKLLHAERIALQAGCNASAAFGWRAAELHHSWAQGLGPQNSSVKSRELAVSLTPHNSAKMRCW